MGPAGMNPRNKFAMEPKAGSARSLEDPPELKPGQDRQKWRRDVSYWMTYISKRASAGEKKSIATLATLSYELYNAVHHSFQSVLDHARDRGELSFEVETFRQRATVEKIIDLIGKDTPLEIVDRLLSYYQRVHTCVRYDDE